MTFVKELKLVETNTVVDVQCNRCGESCWDSQKMNIESLDFSCYWGYMSRKDGENWSGHLCEKCADEFEIFCNNNIDKKDYM